MDEESVAVLIVLIIIGLAILAIFINFCAQQETAQEELALDREEWLRANNIAADITYSFKGALHSKTATYVVDKGRGVVCLVDSYQDLEGYKQDICQVHFSNILGCEILIDNQRTGGVGRAVVGGMIAGETGAVVGAVTAKEKVRSYKIVVYLKSLDMPKFELKLIAGERSKNSSDYFEATKFAENVSASIKAICEFAPSFGDGDMVPTAIVQLEKTDRKKGESPDE